jgi:hypothetical protein
MSVFAGSLSACTAAPADGEVTAKLSGATLTALAAGKSEAVVISNARSTPVRWDWEAVVAGKTYACDADNYMRIPSCSPLQEQAAGR